MKSQLFETSARQKLHWVALSRGDKNRLCKRSFKDNFILKVTFEKQIKRSLSNKRSTSNVRLKVN